MGKKKRTILADLLVSDYAAEGKGLARHEGKVVFIGGVVPGDVADVLLTKNKKDWAEGRVMAIKKLSEDRVRPFCRHFGICGGCKWQMLPYEKQISYKQQEAKQNFVRIGKIENPPMLPIIGAEDTIYYRNKLEFTFSNKRFLTEEEIGTSNEIVQQDALGYHVPRIFDKVIDIYECWLMDEVNNRIRNTIREFAYASGLTYYDIRQHTGWLRNIIVRNCTGGLMVNLCINYEQKEDRELLLNHLLEKVPEITTLLYTINPKWNDSLYDLEPQVYTGDGYVTETLVTGAGNEYRFIIGPKSFFQTNTRQANRLYNIVADFAGLTGNEVVYDLYCGTGSIGIFLSGGAKKIIGVETVAEAVTDAQKNADLNKINHAEFFAGDVIDICNDAFFVAHGAPDIIITDPPRAGMHEKLVKKLLDIAAPRIVYVSCNTATQARDLLLLSEKYTVEKLQPVDMFPHTHHIECVALLQLKH